MNDIKAILDIIASSFIEIWPYLVLTIPLAVAVNLSGAAKHINKLLRKKPFAAIFIATAIGAFSPFCSCGIIPIIASMLLGGVPLAPIMAFWVASPSMDPEIFFLSVGMLGWKLAIWRLTSTLILSLAAGFITHYAVKKGWFGDNILATVKIPVVKRTKDLVLSFFRNLVSLIRVKFNREENVQKFAMEYASNKPAGVNFFKIGSTTEDCGCDDESSKVKEIQPSSCGCNDETTPVKEIQPSSCGCGDVNDINETAVEKNETKISQRILRETWEATSLVIKFMTLAFLVKALITIYVPEEVILGMLGGNNIFSVIIATIIGIPFYTSNLAALPIIGAFLSQGMNEGAALAFLIAGPITTLPAMTAVWGIVNRKVFTVYLAIPLLGAILFGYLFNLLGIF